MASFSFPKIIKTFFPLTFSSKNEDVYISKIKKDFLIHKIEELSKKLNINKPIELILQNSDPTIEAEAIGNNILPGRAAIRFNLTRLMNMPPEAVEFTIAHELAHIKANDSLWLQITAAMIGIITTVAAKILFPSSALPFSNPILLYTVYSPAAIAGIAAAYFSPFLFLRWREKCADLLAASVSSDQAIKADIASLKQIRDQNRQFRKSSRASFLDRLLISENGDQRNITHPSETARINYLSELTKENAS